MLSKGVLRTLLALAYAACCLAQPSSGRHPDTCKSRDGGDWVRPHECEYGCCVDSSDRGKICGSSDDCSHASGAWWLMALLTVAAVFLAVFGCLLLLACFDVPLPCCDKQVRRVLQSWPNKRALKARTRPDSIKDRPTCHSQNTSNASLSKLDDGEPVLSEVCEETRPESVTAPLL